MKIIVNGSKGGGWDNYVLNGTRTKPRDSDLIELLEGNPSVGERVTAQGNWKENEYHIILAFKGKPSRRVVRKAMKEFEKYFMAGFKEDEYHLDAVAHYDTDDTHVHVRIPKMNLHTGTQLQLYWHNKDEARINLIRDHISQKFGLDTEVNEKPLIQESKEVERIQKWREEREQVSFNFKTKKTREQGKITIANAIKKEHEKGNIDSLEQLKIFFEERYPSIPIVNEGHEHAKNFHYFTVYDKKNDRKIRLEGDFYSEEFWGKSREVRDFQFAENKREPKKVEKVKDVTSALEKVTSKRVKEIEDKYRRARAKANQERGREEARAAKYNNSPERNKQDESSGRENRAVTRIRESEEARARRNESSLDRALRGYSNAKQQDYTAIKRFREQRTSTEQRRSRVKRVISIAKSYINSIAKRAKQAFCGGIKIFGHLFERIESKFIKRNQAIESDITERNRGIQQIFIGRNEGALEEYKKFRVRNFNETKQVLPNLNDVMDKMGADTPDMNLDNILKR